uniref:Uncharacterized protein n=1 Tax=Arundo donax TaxID=35708 RepID=A0A0A8ZF77_ARUDO
MLVLAFQGARSFVHDLHLHFKHANMFSSFLTSVCSSWSL